MTGDVSLFQQKIPRVERALSDHRVEAVMGLGCLQSKCATNCAMAPDHGAPSVWMAPRKACCAMVPTRWRETSVATTINNVFNETAWLQPATGAQPIYFGLQHLFSNGAAGPVASDR
jgi:hypothetical protein